MSDDLPWPPPGLRELRGRFRALTRSAATASCVILAASMGFAAYVPDEFWFRDGSAAQLFIIWGGIGVMIMVGTAVHAWLDIRRAAFAVRRGYTWLTVAEAMADHRGDTGTLISGGREFAAATPRVRSAIRVARVTSSLALLMAALVPIPLMVVIGWLDLEVPDSRALLLVVALAPSLALVAVSTVATRVERFAFRASRLGHDDELARRDALRAVIEPWYSTLEAASKGQSMRGPQGGAVVGWAVSSIACAATVLIVASLVPLWIVSVTAPAVFSWRNMRSYASGSNQLVAYARLRQLIPRPDPSISPVQAGEAMHALSMRGARAQPDVVRHPSVALPPYPDVPDSLLPNTHGHSLADVWVGAFPAARRGFSETQRVFFTQLSASAGTELLRTAARAQRADIAAARYAPFHAAMSPFAIPVDPSVFTLDTLAWAQLSRVALLVADGRTSDAVSAISDVIALGFRLADDGISLNDETEGVYLIQVGASGLRALYALDSVGNSRVLALDSVLRPPPGSPSGLATAALRSSPNWTINPTRDKLLETLRDSLLPRSRRFGLTRAAGMLVCTNIRELLFGPAGDLRDALRAAEKDLVRSPAESALFDLNTHAAERAFRSKPGPDGYSLDQSILLKAAHVAGFVLRNERIVNCAELGVGARQIPG